MELAFPWPASPGEWLAWLSAALTALAGLAVILAPGPAMRVLSRHGGDGGSGPGGLAGGFLLGAGLAAMLLAQPLVYLALGLSWAGACLGHALTFLTGRNADLRGLLLRAAGMAAAAMPLAFVFGGIR
ncbi:MAG: DUF4345 domain-containing protein [Pseudomonadota bacterium]|nr:DUF4345 domain-containing protein [Pseudomonadota bacterium]